MLSRDMSEILFRRDCGNKVGFVDVAEKPSSCQYQMRGKGERERASGLTVHLPYCLEWHNDGNLSSKYPILSVSYLLESKSVWVLQKVE